MPSQLQPSDRPVPLSDGSQRRFEQLGGFWCVEERLEDVVHDGPMSHMVGLKLHEGGRSTRPRVAHADRATFEFILPIRQRVCLHIMHHLQFMFDVSEKLIGPSKAALLFR
jgi:hypothetical protein